MSYAMKFLWPLIVAPLVDGATVTGTQSALLDQARKQSMENPGVPLNQPAPPGDYWPTEIATVSREATVVLVAETSRNSRAMLHREGITSSPTTRFVRRE